MSEETKRIAEEILGAYFEGGLPSDLNDQIQGWLASGDSDSDASALMHRIFDQVVQYRPVPSRHARRSYARFLKGLRLKYVVRPQLSLVRRAMRVAAVALPLLGVCAATWLLWPVQGGTLQLTRATDSVLGRGAIENAMRTDGTHVWQNGLANVRYTAFRKATLEGEAYFSVAHNQDVPYTVTTKYLAVTVHGTKFNIEAQPYSTTTCVTLYSGSVSIAAPAGQQITLTPGQRFVLDNITGLYSIVSDFAPSPAWMTGKLHFDGSTLAQILAAVEWYYNVTIEPDDGVNIQGTYVVSFVGDESLEKVMQVLSDVSGNFSYAIEGGNVRIINTRTK